MILTQCKSAPLNISRGGVTPPADIYYNLSAWFNALPQNVVMGTTNLVSQMTDISGKGHNITQATEGLKPLWKDSFCNGYPIVRFRGEITAACNLASASYTIGTPVHWFLAGRALSYVLYDTICTTGGGDYVSPYYTNRTFYIQTTDSYVPIPMVSTPVIIQVSINGSFSFVICNTTRGPFINVSAFGTGGIFMGCRGTGNAGSPFDLAELLLYGGKMDDAQQFRIRKYLGNKYGIDVI